MTDQPGRQDGPVGGGGSPPDDSRKAVVGTSVGAYAGLGLQFALSIVLSAFAGQWLDRRYDTEPWLMLSAVIVGAGGTFYSIYRKLMADLRREEEARKR